MIQIPNMLLIGATGRDAGKTTFACNLIRHFNKRPIQGVKVTVIKERNGECPRGGEGCGVCTSLKGDFCITEELSPNGQKDTARLLAAGASRVLWLRVLQEKLDAGVSALLLELDATIPVICESNSVRNAIQPGVFLMLQRRNAVSVKISAKQVLHYADEIVYSDGERFEFDFARIIFDNGMWVLAV